MIDEAAIHRLVILSPIILHLLHKILSPGGHSLFLPIRVCAAKKGMVFKILSPKQGISLTSNCLG